MSKSLDSIRQQARQKASKSKLEHEAREKSLRLLGSRLTAEVSAEAQRLKSSTTRPIKCGLALACLLLCGQIAILYFSPQLIPQLKSWINSPAAEAQTITLQQLQRIQPTMNDADLALFRALEGFSKEHDKRLRELEDSLSALLASGSDRTKDDQQLTAQLEALRLGISKLTNAYSALLEHYKKSMDSISARLKRLEKAL
jgi:hypothetical protein